MGEGWRKERTAGNDARTDVEKKRMEKYQDRYSTRKKEQRCPEEEGAEGREGGGGGPGRRRRRKRRRRWRRVGGVGGREK